MIRKRNSNKRLYESIMRDVAKIVKKHLNESNMNSPFNAIIKLFNMLGINSVGADYEEVTTLDGDTVYISEINLENGNLDIHASDNPDTTSYSYDETEFDDENLWQIFYIIRNNASYFVKDMSEDEIYKIADRLEQ